MDKWMNFFASVLAITLVGAIWINYFQTGCWAVGRANNGNDDALLCGIPGLAIGTAITCFTFFYLGKWFKNKD